MFAHITKVGNGFELRITHEVRPVGGIVVWCANKKAARAVAASHNAKPWNF